MASVEMSDKIQYEIWTNDCCLFKTENNLQWCIGFIEGYQNGVSDCGCDYQKMLVKMKGSIIWTSPE